MNKIIQLPGMTIDFSALRSTFSADGLPRWSGKVALTFVDTIDNTTTVITANWAGKDESTEGMLVDFEGEPEANDPIYEACELHAADWSREISERLGRPSRWDAHNNDIRDRKARNMPPFDRVA